MPMQWIEPEIFLEHKNVPIYRMYKDDDAERPLTYHFTTSATCGQDDIPDGHAYDVRELAVPARGLLGSRGPDADETIRRILIEAIDAGLITVPEAELDLAP
jgi:hypothetical protein